MVRLRQLPLSGKPAQHEHLGHNVSLLNAGTVALLSILALAAYFILDRTLAVQHESATAIAFREDERMLTQRIASLAAQYALGNDAVRHDLRSAVVALESTHAKLVAQDRNAGLLYASADRPLESTSSDAAPAYIARARRIAALSPHDPSMGAQTAALFLTARRPIVDRLNAAVRARQARAERELTILRVIGAAICASILGTLLVAVVAVFRPMARRIVQLSRDADELGRLATVDPLTGTLNKRSFQARGAIEIQKARRYQRPLSLLVIDADHLPAIEGEHGIDGGETLLKALTSSFFAGTRVTDLVARVDAEQFAILLPETNCEGAVLLAERLRRKISDLSVPIDDDVVSCTVSIGVAAAEKDASFLWPTFKRADEALYEAKQRGRNRVVAAAAA